MQLNYHELLNPVRTLDGTTVPYSVIDGESALPLTIAQCIRHSLTAQIRNDQTENAITDDQAFKDYDLSKEVLNCPEGGTVEINSAMSTRIQTLSRKVFGKEIGGYIRDVLEQRIKLIGNSIPASKGNGVRETANV